MEKLLPSQIKILEEKLIKLRQERHELIKSCSDDLNKSRCDGTEFSDPQDFTYRINLHQLDENIKEIENLLNQSKQINLDDYSENRIDIGTLFTATMEYDGEIETDEYILVSNRNGNNPERKINFISENSPLGQVVKGKKIGEPFYYNVGDNLIVGFIEDISTIDEVKNLQKSLKR